MKIRRHKKGETDDERAALLLVGAREMRHRVEDLDPRVLVDIDGAHVVGTESKSKYSTTDVEKREKDVHCGQRSMDSRAPDLDGHERVEDADGGFKGDEVAILVGEDAELSRLDTKADSSRDVLLGRLEPCVPLSCQYVKIELNLDRERVATYLRGTASARRRRSCRSP